MANAKLTLQGLDRYASTGLIPGVTSLWDGLNVPEGASKDTLVNAILYRSFEYPVIYMDAVTVHDQISLISDMYADTMQRTWTALTADYNPIHNFDRYEDYTDDREGSDTREGTSKQAGTGKSELTSQDDSTSKQGYYGDTAETYNPASKTDTNGTGKERSTSETTADINTVDKGISKDKLSHNGHLYGNIGVTTSQQMLTAEVDLRMQYNWYNTIADLFVRELCIGIY